MKNLKSYIALVCTVALAVSCNNVLDTSPTNLLNDNQVWSSKNAIDAYLGQLYDSMQVEDLEYQIESEGQYLSEFTDEAVRAYTWGRANYALIPEGVFGWWGYKEVRNTNTFLDNINNAAALTPEERKVYEAEARFCRAMNYFAMVKRYGGCLLYTSDAADEL